jgi:ATP-binding cassette, subfamily B (MDR/TAP), member 10
VTAHLRCVASVQSALWCACLLLRMSQATGRRGAVHASLLAVYSWGGFLVARGLLPVRLLLSAIGYTFALIFSTQGAIQSTADLRKATASVRRWC